MRLASGMLFALTAVRRMKMEKFCGVSYKLSKINGHIGTDLRGQRNLSFLNFCLKLELLLKYVSPCREPRFSN